jgi:hypothetical protein
VRRSPARPKFMHAFSRNAHAFLLDASASWRPPTWYNNLVLDTDRQCSPSHPGLAPACILLTSVQCCLVAWRPGSTALACTGNVCSSSMQESHVASHAELAPQTSCSWALAYHKPEDPHARSERGVAPSLYLDPLQSIGLSVPSTVGVTDAGSHVRAMGSPAPRHA